MDYLRYSEFPLPKEEGDVFVCVCGECGALVPDDYDHRKLHDGWHDRSTRDIGLAAIGFPVGLSRAIDRSDGGLASESDYGGSPPESEG